MTQLHEGSAAEAGMLPKRIGRLRAIAKRWVAEGHTPSLVVLVARRGVIVLHEAFGKLRPEADSPALRVDSIFPVASITKPMTATAAMILVEDGVLGLNRPVRDYLPEICDKGTEDVLVHHLLTHSSGYSDEEILPIVEQKFKEGFDPGPCDETQHPASHWFLALCYPVPPGKPPGAEMIYCNVNYLLLGEIIRRLAGRSLADFAQERIFGPLGMKDTYYSVPTTVSPRVVRRPSNAPFGQPTGADPGLNSRESEERPWAFAGVYSTAKDLAIFGQTFLNCGTYGRARILSRPAVAAMTRDQIPGIGARFGTVLRREASYGYGWIVESNDKWKYWNGSLTPLGTFSHPGSGGCSFWVDPANEIVGVYLAVVMHITKDLENLWDFDLFQNAVTSAVAE